MMPAPMNAALFIEADRATLVWTARRIRRRRVETYNHEPGKCQAEGQEGSLTALNQHRPFRRPVFFYGI